MIVAGNLENGTIHFDLSKLTCISFNKVQGKALAVLDNNEVISMPPEEGMRILALWEKASTGSSEDHSIGGKPYTQEMVDTLLSQASLALMALDRVDSMEDALAASLPKTGYYHDLAVAIAAFVSY